MISCIVGMCCTLRITEEWKRTMQVPPLLGPIFPRIIQTFSSAFNVSIGKYTKKKKKKNNWYICSGCVHLTKTK